MSFVQQLTQLMVMRAGLDLQLVTGCWLQGPLNIQAHRVAKQHSRRAQESIYNSKGARTTRYWYP